MTALPTVEVMDRVAARLGAPSHRAFLAIAQDSMKSCFKLACQLETERAVLRALLVEARGHPTVSPCDCGAPGCLTTRIDAALAGPSE